MASEANLILSQQIVIKRYLSFHHGLSVCKRKKDDTNIDNDYFKFKEVTVKTNPKE